MFGRERMLRFVYGPPKDGFDILPAGIRFQAAIQASSLLAV